MVSFHFMHNTTIKKVSESVKLLADEIDKLAQ